MSLLPPRGGGLRSEVGTVLILRAEIFDAIEKEAGWNNVEEEACIAVMMQESGGNPGAIGDDGHSIGLWQLHDKGAGAHMTDDDRLSIARSTAVAIRWLGDLYGQLENWRDVWSAYNQGYAGWQRQGTDFNKAYVDAVESIYGLLAASDVARADDLPRWVEWA